MKRSPLEEYLAGRERVGGGCWLSGLTDQAAEQLVAKFGPHDATVIARKILVLLREAA